MSIIAASLAFQGQDYTLTYNASTGKYEATLTAPSVSSWKEPDHVFTGAVSATNRDDLGVENTITEAVAVRVLETDAPEITVITPEDWEITTNPQPAFRWIVRDAESGIDPETITVKLDGEAQSGVSYVAFGGYYQCEWADVVPEGQHVLSFDVSDNDGNAAETVTLNYAALFFITDRTAADVERVKYLAAAVQNGTATEEESAEWETDLKGAYNASDMNRVGLGVYFIGQWAARYGYALILTARRDWIEEQDGPTRGEGAVYLSDIQTVRAALPVYASTPDAPESMRFLDYTGANDIEQILTDIIEVMPRAALSFIASGEAAAGEF